MLKHFASYHVVAFQKQNHNIMPVFMLVYSDNTYRTIPFLSTTKATFYRKMHEVIEIQDFDDIVAVLYCGECYAYDLDQLSQLNRKPYSERTKFAKKELLSFSMLVKGGNKMAVYIDESRIDDGGYVAEEIKKCDWLKENDVDIFNWLDPIKDKLT